MGRERPPPSAALPVLSPRRTARFRSGGEDLKSNPLTAKRQLAFFSDEPRLFDYLSVRQHLEFTARLYQVDDAPERSRELLEQLDLDDKAHLLQVNFPAA
jgi:ABC-2 type transport system ATP-binding protein